MCVLEKAYNISSTSVIPFRWVVDESEQLRQRTAFHHQCSRVHLVRSLGVFGEFPLTPKSLEIWRFARFDSGEEVCDVYPDFI